MHCRTHPSTSVTALESVLELSVAVCDCLPAHQFTVPSEPLP